MATRARQDPTQSTPRKRSTDAAASGAPAARRSTRRAGDGAATARAAAPAKAASTAGMQIVQATEADAAALQHEPAAAEQAASEERADSVAGATPGANGNGQPAGDQTAAQPPTAWPFPMGGLMGMVPGMGMMPGMGMPPSTGTPAGAGTPAGMAPALGMSFGLDAAKIAAVQQEYLTRLQSLMMQAGNPKAIAPKDKRFSDPSWQEGINALSASLYLLNADALNKMAEAVQGDAKTRERVRFAVQQWVDAMSPANYLATNPEAIARIVQTQGKSLAAGIENLMGDIARGRISQTDETAFEVGRNVATSPGDVVWQNDLIQLIQYAPSTPQVGSVPILMVPPCINKFYILDLQPDNSYVANAVEHGHTVFMLSWRNVGIEQGRLTWDDYLEQGVLAAIDRVRDIAGVDEINLLGFCVGGTLLSTALAALAARGERPARSLTLLTTLLDFEDTGQLGMFIDESLVRRREQQIGKGGLLAGRELASTFSSLRPNDLVWNYVVNNYLKGEPPAAFDLLYWNADSTNLPGPMYCWYLRNTYLENRLKTPGSAKVLGEPVDLGAIDMPAYVFGAREDHIVPWRAAYRSAQLLGGEVRYVLGASGHIAGTINSAKKNKRSFWTSERNDLDADAWVETAAERPGSWWNDWTAWLEQFKGDPIPAHQARSDKYPALEPAPGSYVKQRAV